MSNEVLVELVQRGIDTKGNMEILYKQNQGLLRDSVYCYDHLAESADLMQEAYIGMHKAVMEYDNSKGCTFGTFARSRIKWHLIRYIEKNRPVHVPAGIQQQIRTYYKTKEVLTHVFGCEPSDNDIQADMQISRQQYACMLQALSAGNLSSLDAPLKEEGGDSLYEIVPTAEDVEESVMDEATAANLKRELWGAVDELPAMQSAVIRAKYQKGKRLMAEVCEELGLEYNQTREEERKALKNLRSFRYRKRYENYLPELYRAKAYRGNGVGNFKATWTSSTERIAILMT